MLLGKILNCGFWFTEIKRATINRNSTTGASRIDWRSNTLVCHATPDRNIRDGFCLSGFWWPDNSHSLFLQKWSKVNITSLYIRLEQKKVISWDANRLWVWGVSLVREGGGGGGWGTGEAVNVFHTAMFSSLLTCWTCRHRIYWIHRPVHGETTGNAKHWGIVGTGFRSWISTALLQ